MSNDDHELRDLRWKLKQLSKQNGRQGNTIYNLRAQLAEARAITGKIERGAVRTLERTLEVYVEQIVKLQNVNAELQEKIETLGASTMVGVKVAAKLADELDASEQVEKKRRRGEPPQIDDPDYVHHRTIKLDGNRFVVFGRSGKVRFRSHEYYKPFNAKKGAKAFAKRSHVPIKFA